MIVKRVWVTRKITKKSKNRPRGLRCKQSWWKGWFLFGIIPLFIIEYNIEYSELGW
jgi:hypothetical protein